MNILDETHRLTSFNKKQNKNKVLKLFFWKMSDN